MKRAFVTGAAGQDGSYMCDRLLRHGYKVMGLVRPSGDDRLWRLRKALDHKNFELMYGNILDKQFPFHVADAKFDEVYHLAAQSHVHQAFYTAGHTIDVNATATAHLLDALWARAPKTKFYFAATSEMFGDMQMGEKADESFPLSGRSPYAAAKVAAHLLCRVYRTKGMFVVSGISFNHESCRRGENFVTRKLGLGLAKGPVKLGNVKAFRDWHHAVDAVRGMHRALLHHEPDEYVFASGVARSVEELAHAMCARYGVDYDEYIIIEEAQKRPWDVDYLCGDARKAEEVLGFGHEYSFTEIVEDLCRVEQ